MKKIFLSTFVLASFGLYVMFQGPPNSLSYVATPTTVTSPIEPKKAPKPSTVTTSTTPAVNTSSEPVKASREPILPKKNGLYNDGVYIGDSIDAYYGYIQVKAVVSNGKLSDVVFLDYPHDRGTSIRINSYAMPILKSEAIKAQSSNVNIVSGATDSSGAFRESLASALSQAKI